MTIDYQAVADQYAERVRELDFLNCEGTHWDDKHELVVLFGKDCGRNHVARRFDDLMEIRRKAALVGFEELAYAENPPTTYALLLAKRDWKNSASQLDMADAIRRGWAVSRGVSESSSRSNHPTVTEGWSWSRTVS